MSLQLEEEVYFRNEHGVVCHCKFIMVNGTTQLTLKTEGSGKTRAEAYNRAIAEANEKIKIPIMICELDATEPKQPSVKDWVVEHEGKIIVWDPDQAKLPAKILEYFSSRGISHPKGLAIYPLGCKPKLSGSV